MSKLAKTFIENVRHTMGEKTNYWLANESGLSQSSISRIMSEEVIPNLETVEQISRAVRVAPHDLLRPKPPKKNLIPNDILENLEGESEIVFEAIRTLLKAVKKGK